MLVSVDAGVDDVAEQVMHDVTQHLGRDHAVQGADKDRLAGVKALGRLTYMVTV